MGMEYLTGVIAESIKENGITGNNTGKGYTIQ